MKHFVLGAVAALALGVSGAAADDYPSKEIQGVIQWGAGGSTDTVMRSITPHTEKVLGGTVVMQNMTGGVGAIALNHVANSNADGYTILMGAENPLLYKVMGLGQKDYSDFEPIALLTRGTPILVAGKDAPFDDYAGMMDYIRANPGELRIGSTGPGGLPSVITAMMNTVEGELDVIAVPYDGDGPALTALQGGAIDVMPAVLGASIEGIRAGSMKPLAIFDVAANKHLPDVPTVTSFNAAYETYLPWGPFFGIFAPKGADVTATLSAAYAEALKNPEFLELMDNRVFAAMGLSGAEAEAFLAKWREGAAWRLQDAGLTKNPDREFGDGAMEGLMAPETANNAAVGGAFIPMMTLGIPGDAVTAIMIGALFIHGLNPGPMLMIDQPDMFWFIVGCLITANCFMLLFGLTGIRLFTRIVEMPRSVLIPLIMLLSIVGAYAVNNAITDVYWMLAFGIFGYFMRHYGYPLGPVILGVILSRLLDDNWRRAIISEREDLGRFFEGIVTSPLSLVLFVSVILIFVSQTPIWSRGKARLFSKDKRSA